MLGILTYLHVGIALVLILIVLIQGSKGSELGAAFGGGSQTVFGSSGGATFFTKLTAVVAVLFMCFSIILAKMSTNKAHDSVVPTQIEEIQKEAPAATIPAAKEAKENPPVDTKE
jgi:preprotein translocase subunit SecG